MNIIIISQMFLKQKSKEILNIILNKTFFEKELNFKMFDIILYKITDEQVVQ